MKKVLSLVILVLALVALLASCTHNHYFDEWEIVKRPTCTTDGEKVRYCPCGEKQSEIIIATEHDYVDGVCANCGDVMSADNPSDPEEPECQHTATEVISAVNPTCTDSGLTEGSKCVDCGETIVEQTIVDALGHTIVADEAVAPTCTEAGLTAGEHCSVCDYEVAQETIPALGHTEEDVPGKAPNCTETGLTEGKKCSVCGDTIVANEMIPAAGHKDDDGDYICDICEADLCTEHLAGEAVEENRNEASCTKAGSYDSVVKCAHCGEELSRETVVIPMISHTEEIVAGKDATCTATGLTEGKKCSICGNTLVAQETIPALGHTIVTDEAVAPTCTATGLTAGEHCSVCDYVKAQDVVPALGHDLVDVEGKDATCTEDGYTAYKDCSRCDYIEGKEVVEALGNTHNYIAVTTSPTCTEDGYTTYTCACGDSYIADQTNARGHRLVNFTDNKDDATHTSGCSRCEYTEVQEHTFEGDFKICACGNEKKYQYICTSMVNDCTCSDGNPHILTMSQLANMKQCGVSGHNPYHPVCSTCKGCLKEVNPCKHETVENYVRVDSKYHVATCVECKEEIQFSHSPSIGTCTLCGNHNHHESGYINNGSDTTHEVTCTFCDVIVTKPHTFIITSKNAAGHTGTCSQCNATVALAHTDGVDCAVCGFKFCSHPNATYVYLGNGTHQWTCNGISGTYGVSCHIGTKAPEAHILDENGACTLCGYNPTCTHPDVNPTATGALCSGCNTYIYAIKDSVNFTSTTKAYLKNGYDCVIYFSNADASSPKSVAAFQLGMNASNTVKSVTLDLQGGTLKLTGAITNYVKNLTIRNGTIETSSYITASVAANITLENVTIIKTGSGNGLFTGATGTNIKIINSTIDVSGATNKRVAYFHAASINNVNIEIADSEIICGAGHLVYFYNATQPNMANNSVTITNTTVNGTKVETAGDVQNYIHGTNKEQMNVTVQ